MIKPITTEKAIRIIELENKLVFQVDLKMRKKEIRKEIEDVFNVKVDSIRTLIKRNKKIVYAKLNSKNPAIDVATKLGII